MAIVEGQLVKVKWNGASKKHYESKGYLFTKMNDEFIIPISHLSATSQTEVEMQCDYCLETFKRKYSNCYNSKNHFCLEECRERFNNPNNWTNQERLDKSVEGLIELQSILDKIPTVSEYDRFAKDNGLFVRRVIQAKTNKNWNDLCENLFGDVNVLKKSKEDMLSELINLRNELGRTPFTDELIKYGLSEYKTYLRKFNMTYNELVQSLGWETNGNFTAEIPKEELYSKFKVLYKKLGRIPTWGDIRSEDDYPSDTTFYSKCGSILDICKYLNIPIDNSFLRLNKSGCGFSFIDKKGDFCRSYPEMIITNLLIENNIKYIKEKKYAEVIPEDQTKRRFDWYLPDYEICIEYFGLFTENPQGDMLVKYHMKTKDKIKTCKNNDVTLLDLYKDDLENDKKGLINKFKNLNIHIQLHQTGIVV